MSFVWLISLEMCWRTGLHSTFPRWIIRHVLTAFGEICCFWTNFNGSTNGLVPGLPQEIHIIISFKFQCAPWTWFLSVKIYCSSLVVLIILLTRRTAYFGMIVSTSCFICSILLSVFLDFQPSHAMETDVAVELRTFNFVHETPWILIGPFLIGKQAGEICFQSQCKLRISETIKILGWILAFLVLAIIVSGRIAFGLFPDFHSINVGFTGISHSLFCIVAAWLAIAKVQSGWQCKWTRPLSKISVACLLLHPLIIRLFVIVLGSNSLPDANWMTLVVVHLGLLVCTIFLSLFVFLVFEAPFSVFKRRYLRKFVLQ